MSREQLNQIKVKMSTVEGERLKEILYPSEEKKKRLKALHKDVEKYSNDKNIRRGD